MILEKRIYMYIEYRLFKINLDFYFCFPFKTSTLIKNNLNSEMGRTLLFS